MSLFMLPPSVINDPRRMPPSRPRLCYLSASGRPTFRERVESRTMAKSKSMVTRLPVGSTPSRSDLNGSRCSPTAFGLTPLGPPASAEYCIGSILPFASEEPYKQQHQNRALPTPPQNRVSVVTGHADK